MPSFGFLVASHLTCEEHKNCLVECIESILKFYKQYQIVVIFSGETHTYLKEQIFKLYTEIKYETATGAASSSSLYFLKKNRYFDIAVTLQDSMTILKEFDVSAIDTVKYLWHSTNHRIHWSSIKEPETEFNIKNNIKTHDDLILYFVKNVIKDDYFRQYCLNTYMHKDMWVVCFGPCVIIRTSFLDILDSKTGLIDLMFALQNHRERRAGESLLALACQYAVNKEIHDSYDGLNTDGYSYYNKNKGEYISKSSHAFNR